MLLYKGVFNTHKCMFELFFVYEISHAILDEYSKVHIYIRVCILMSCKYMYVSMRKCSFHSYDHASKLTNLINHANCRCQIS